MYLRICDSVLHFRCVESETVFIKEESSELATLYEDKFKTHKMGKCCILGSCLLNSIYLHWIIIGISTRILDKININLILLLYFL